VIVLFEARDTAGKIAFFDCTCFGRAGVERVMGSCKPLEYLEFLRQSPAMERMLDRWDDYTEAKKAMFFHTDTADAPWTVIKSDDKKRARINCMRHFLHALPYPDKNPKVASQADHYLVGPASRVIDAGERIIDQL
jgi:polyphosphate kinase 2 (PPK2 family)